MVASPSDHLAVKVGIWRNHSNAIYRSFQQNTYYLSEEKFAKCQT